MFKLIKLLIFLKSFSLDYNELLPPPGSELFTMSANSVKEFKDQRKILLAEGWIIFDKPNAMVYTKGNNKLRIRYFQTFYKN